MRFPGLSPKITLGLAAGIALATAHNARCQANPTPSTASAQPQIPAFAVTSVRPNPKATGWRLSPTADGWSGMGATMYTLLDEAYGPLHQDKIVGLPQWADAAKYDVEGKVDDADLATFQKLHYPQQKLMLQALLEDRFKLKVHFEPQMQPVFVLSIAKGGAKIKQTTPDELPADINVEYGFIRGSGRGKFDAINLTLAGFAETFGGWTGRVVVDKTGLAGRYDFKLQWSPDSELGAGHPAASNGNEPPALEAPTGPSIFTAVEEQLGLKLLPDKAPLPALVIDHIEEPSPN